MQVGIDRDILTRQTSVVVINETSTMAEQLVRDEDGRDKWIPLGFGDYAKPYATFRNDVWDAVRAQIESELVEEHRKQTPTLGDRDADRVDKVLDTLLAIVGQRQE